MKRHAACAVFLILSTLGYTACSGGSELISSDAIDTAYLLRYLQDEGVGVLSMGPSTQPFFSQSGQEYALSGGGMLQVYEYRSEASATLDSRQVNTEQMRSGPWARFYREGRVIAIYFGDDPLVEKVLNQVLGPLLV